MQKKTKGIGMYIAMLVLLSVLAIALFSWTPEPVETLSYSDVINYFKQEQVEEYSPIHTAEINEKYEKLGTKPVDYHLTRKAKHYFAATPSKEAKTVSIVIKDRFGNEWKEELINIF